MLFGFIFASVPSEIHSYSSFAVLFKLVLDFYSKPSFFFFFIITFNNEFEKFFIPGM